VSVRGLIEFADRILIFAVLERWLLQLRETGSSFLFYNICGFIRYRKCKHDVNQSNWRFFDFSKWRPPPPWIFRISIFNGRKAQEGQTASTYQILWRSVKPVLRNGNFSIFFKIKMTDQTAKRENAGRENARYAIRRPLLLSV